MASRHRLTSILPPILAVGLVLGFAAPARADVPGFVAFETHAVSATDETQRAYEAVQAVVEQTPDQYTGVRIDGPNALTVSIPDGLAASDRADAIQRIATQAAGAAPVKVTIAWAPRSRAALGQVKAQIAKLIRAKTYGSQIIGVGTDAVRGIARVYASDDSAAARVALKRRFGAAIEFHHLGTPQDFDADRNRDSAPHWGGAGFYMWNDPHTGYRGWCSTGFPITKDGVRYMLTAGHCFPGSSGFVDAWATAFTTATPVPSTSYYFGTRYTTTASGTLGNVTGGTQDRYGDWALLRGSSYEAKVYNCSNVTGNCSSLPVGTASWVVPSDGAALCTSGRTTGQVCRQHVTDPDWSGYWNGVFHSQITLFRRDDGGCGGPAPGDSGGAVYQAMSSRPGYMRALGIVKGGTSSCNYLYSRLSGVRAWNSSVTMPTL